MNSNARLDEVVTPIVAAAGLLLTSTLGDTDYVSLKGYRRCQIIISIADGTTVTGSTITLKQATDVAGTSAKNLTVVTDIHKKQGTLTAVGTWTTTTQAAAATYAGDGTSAEEQAVYVVEIEADQLDADNGFDCINVACSDVGTNAQLGCALYILYGLRNGGAPATLPNSIAD